MKSNGITQIHLIQRRTKGRPIYLPTERMLILNYKIVSYFIFAFIQFIVLHILLYLMPA